MQCQLIDTLRAPFVLKSLFDEVDAEAMDTEPAQVQELEGDMMEVYYEVHGMMQINDNGDSNDSNIMSALPSSPA